MTGLIPEGTDPTLAFVITGIGETFRHADVIAGHEPDMALAVDVLGRLLRQSSQQP